MQTLYLSRRNLLALLSKLDRCKTDPDASLRTIVKQDTTHPKYPASDVIRVTAVEDAEYYDRPAGEVFPADLLSTSGSGKVDNTKPAVELCGEIYCNSVLDSSGHLHIDGTRV